MILLDSVRLSSGTSSLSSKFTYLGFVSTCLLRWSPLCPCVVFFFFSLATASIATGLAGAALRRY